MVMDAATEGGLSAGIYVGEVSAANHNVLDVGAGYHDLLPFGDYIL